MDEILLLKTTESDENIAKNISRLLIHKKLAACVSLKEIYSIYNWNDEIKEEREIEILIKSKPELVSELIVFLKKMLSNNVPQIIHTKFKSEKAYLKWVNQSVI